MTHLVVEGGAGVRANALLAGTESSEILGGLRDDVSVELGDDPPFELPSDADVHEAPRPRHLRLLLARSLSLDSSASLLGGNETKPNVQRNKQE